MLFILRLVDKLNFNGSRWQHQIKSLAKEIEPKAEIFNTGKGEKTKVPYPGLTGEKTVGVEPPRSLFLKNPIKRLFKKYVIILEGP